MIDNMREIKFRAWVKEEGSKGGFCNFDLGNERISIRAVDRWNQQLIDDKANVRIEPWQQFTGLQDKNGKEIYEGDIVKHARGNCEVYFNHGAFVITYPETKQWHLLNYGGAQNLEIIGNIYENPELLNPETDLSENTAC